VITTATIDTTTAIIDSAVAQDVIMEKTSPLPKISSPLLENGQQISHPTPVSSLERILKH
jgi:hypothetical protein